MIKDLCNTSPACLCHRTPPTGGVPRRSDHHDNAGHPPHVLGAAQPPQASRARIQAALSRFFTWAEQHDQIISNPMTRIESVRVETPLPRPRPRADVEAVFAVIPSTNRRDHLLFRLLLELGLRVSEVSTLTVEDLSLERDNERITVLGKGGKRRTLLLDDPKLVKRLKAYLQQTGFRHGLVFRAAKNGDGGPLRYQSVQDGGPRTARQPVSFARSISCATPMPANWSPMA